MLDIAYLRANRSECINRLKVKNFNSIDLIDELIEKDDLRKSTQQQLDELLSNANRIAKEIGRLYKQGERDKAEELKKESYLNKENVGKIQTFFTKLNKDILNLLVKLPNLPHHTVPQGKSSNYNQIIKESSNQIELRPESKPHWDLATKYNLISFDLGNKITGSGFPVYIGQGARLQRSLISYFLDKNIQSGYTEYLPPHLVNEDSAFGTGQLPDKDEQMYQINSDSLFLIPTAEVPITNLFRNTILEEKDLPIKATSYTPCFRREAGSYGKSVRGLNRLHQFDKVEIVQIDNPEDSYKTLDKMVKHVSSILEELALPYRILKLCGGDLGFTSALTYDFEVFSAAQKRWLEVSSVSNFETYQSRRIKLRYRDKDGKINYCHSLNGSALALPRIFASIIENNQTPNGIQVPKALQPYTGFDFIS